MTDTSRTLADFLLARIEEDQVKRATMREWHAQDCDAIPQLDSEYTYPCNCGVPERIGLECEAKRRIVELHAGEHECMWAQGTSPTDYTETCLTLRLLAAPYSYHPEFRPEWETE